jgi:hypothetical protein
MKNKYATLTVFMGLTMPLAIMQGGCANVLSFSTATKFGLDITQRADQTIDVTMGYDRAEIASIPAPKNRPAVEKADGNNEDAYSVLGSFKVSYDNPWSKKPLVIDQFFATGWAARKAANHPSMQVFFGNEVGEIANNSKQPKGE